MLTLHGVKTFVDVILPLPLDCLFTYLVPDSLTGHIRPGTRIRVPFGHSRTYTGVAVRVHNDEPAGYKVKPIISADETVVLVSSQMRLIDWMSEYYLCSKGDVTKAMLPVVLRPGSDCEREFKPRTECCVRLREQFDQDALNRIFDSLSRARKQYDILIAYLDLSGLADSPGSAPGLVSKRTLLSACNSPSALDSLVDKGVLEYWEHEIGWLPVYSGPVVQPNALNDDQRKAYADICSSFSSKNICLLHGVTSSGKTEVYIHLIKKVLEQGGQVLFLLPEIALTLHIMNRLQRVFGDAMCVYHSRLSDAGRAEIWKRQLGPNPYRLVVGARSAVFLPFTDLRLAIVDEEHDSSYKQEDPAPRYNARNLTMVLASFFNAKVLLGSATPSLETYSSAMSGKYGLAVMNRRYMDIPLPDIQVVDEYELRRKKRMSGLFSPLLADSIRTALRDGNQVILFRNRRGYANQVSCKSCGWTPKCECCDVGLTWHKRLGRLSCHYCGKLYELPKLCPQCGGTSFGPSGYGTEKVEEEIGRLFPEAVVGRLDTDTVTSSLAYDRIMQDFQEGVTNVLIGTQMVSKGLDFERVSVVGVLSADSIMGAPDFRSAERAFQMMQQVSGRAGRRHGRGLVVIQTRQADDDIYSYVRSGSYRDFYDREIVERQMFNYPPFCKIIYIYLKSADDVQLESAAEWLGCQLRLIFPDRVLGPDAPPVSRIQMQYIRKLMLKIESGVSTAPVRERLRLLRSEFEKRHHRVTLYFDVDPM